MDAAAINTAAAPWAHLASAPAQAERRTHDMKRSPRVLAFCAVPRTRTDVRLEHGEAAIETLKNLVHRGKLVNLGPGPDGLTRFVQASERAQYQTMPRRPGVRSGLVAALQAARACIHTDRVHLADSHMSPASNEIDDEDALEALAEYDAVLKQIDEALERAGAQA